MVDLIKSCSATNDQIRRLKSLKASDRLLQPLTLSLLFMVKRSRVMAIIEGNQCAKVNDRKSFDVQPRLVSAIFFQRAEIYPRTDGRLEGAEQRRRRGRGGAVGEEG